MTSRVLILSLANWLGAARLPGALRSAGFEVGVVAEPTSHIAQSRYVDRLFPISAARTQLGLLTPIIAAIADMQPTLVVPGDESAARLLTALAYGRGAAPAYVREILLRSLGRVDDAGTRFSRRSARVIARRRGVAMSPSRSLRSLDEAARFAVANGWPVVLKREGTAGGAGVRICHNAEELGTAWKALNTAPKQPFSLKALAHRTYWTMRSGFRLAGDLTRPAAAEDELSIEAYVPGRPAYCTVAAKDGQVLAALSVIVRRMHPEPTGPSTIVEAIDNPKMEYAARTLVAELGLTGFCGLDFMISEADGTPYFLELNARATPIVHLGKLLGRDLCAALERALCGQPPVKQTAPARAGTIALFPQDWRRDPAAGARRADFLDVPYDDPGLLASLSTLVPGADLMQEAPIIEREAEPALARAVA